MNHHIKANGKLIASFEEDTDRDIAFDAFVDYWGEDNDFTKEDD